MTNDELIITVQRIVDQWWDENGVVVHGATPHPLTDLTNRLTDALSEMAKQ